ncbi:predicted protein [Histoplasma capsulatum H143]|uniref:Uncharacterized protein n=1 Tax=Ajellomyces capsulatus (strain H143) TaxID=544712 RepID=C6HB47_AJECH|nr:predicted protein [Histoplasma capsulatum H143]
MLQLRFSPNRAKCISVLLVAFRAATECTSISGYQAKRRSLQAICDNSLMPYLLSSESCGHIPSAVTNPTSSSPLLAGFFDNHSLELCEPFNPKSGTPRSLERQGEGLKFPRKNRPVWFSKSQPNCDYGSIKTDPEPASREKGTLDSWQKASKKNLAAFTTELRSTWADEQVSQRTVESNSTVENVMIVQIMYSPKLAPVSKVQIPPFSYHFPSANACFPDPQFCYEPSVRTSLRIAD